MAVRSNTLIVIKYIHKLIKTFVSILVLIGTISFLISCANEPIDELNKKINIALRSGNEITESERKEIKEFIKEYSLDLPQLIGAENEVDEDALTELILSISDRRRNTSSPKVFNPKNDKENINEDATINVFIENSGSMDGYVRGITDFEIAIGKMLVLSKDYTKGDININFINKKVYPAPKIKELTDFAKALEPSKGSPYYEEGGIKNRSESILNNVLKIIIDSTSTNDISILVSDCIYSLGETKDTKSSLAYQQNGTMEAFKNKFRKDSEMNLSTMILKMKSNYNGKYFPYNYERSQGNYIKLTDEKYHRPYYIWVLGDNKLVKKFIKKVNFKNLKGFEKSYYLTNDQTESQPYFTVLKITNKIGDFRPTDKKARDLRSIKDIEYENGKLQFSIAIDLNNIPVDDSYLINHDNYNLPDGYSITSINKVDRNKVEPRDFLTIEKTTATHIITVATTNEYTLKDFKLQLSNRIPSWVEESNSVDDTDVKSELQKTFGLQYLIKGVSEAYITQNRENGTYFNINVEIKK